MKYRQHGFTLVEIIVVITVIVILASLTYFAYGDWRTDTQRTKVENELRQAFAELKNHQNFNSGYPDTAGFSALYTPSGDTTLNYSKRVDGSFCMNAEPSAGNKEGARMHIDSRSGDSVRDGTCT